jgi:hypothetical protein
VQAGCGPENPADGIRCLGHAAARIVASWTQAQRNPHEAGIVGCKSAICKEFVVARGGIEPPTIMRINYLKYILLFVRV